MKKLCVGLVLASAFLASTAMAGESGGGIELGARLGYGLPMGDASKDNKLSDGISGMIPIWLDVGYRVTPNIYAGIYAQYGIVMIKKAEAGKSGGCPEGADCSGSNLRFGINGQYHISPGESMDPWVGVGIGYEIASSKYKMNGVESTGSTKGMEFINLQGGADFKVAPSMAVGPFLSFSMGQYSTSKVETPMGTIDGDIKDKAMHQWLVLGVRGTFGL